MKKRILPFLILGLFAAAVAYAQTTLVPKETGHGTQWGTKPSQGQAWWGATPVPQPSASAQGTVVPVASATVAPSATATVSPAAPAATVTPAAVPTITPTDTPVGSTINPTITRLNESVAALNLGIADAQALVTKVNSLITTADTNTTKINQLVADEAKILALLHQIRTDLKTEGLIKGSQ